MRRQGHGSGKVIWRKKQRALIFAAQEQALRTNWIRKNIDDQELSEIYKMFGERVTQSLTWLQSVKSEPRKNKFCKVKWYNYKPASAVENDRVKILWNFNIQTDHVIQNKRLDIVVLHKTERRCHFIDITVPGDKRIKLQKQEMKTIWNLSQVVVAPVVIGALGVTSKILKDWLKKLNVKSSIDLLQKAALKLETWGCWVPHVL